MTTFCLLILNASPIILTHFTVKKNISNAKFNKVEKLQLLTDFRSNFAVKLNRESHHSNFVAKCCGKEYKKCTLCFHCRTGSCTFTNVENGWWMVMSQLPARGSQSMTKIVVSVLVRYESRWLEFMVFHKGTPPPGVV